MTGDSMEPPHAGPVIILLSDDESDVHNEPDVHNESDGDVVMCNAVPEPDVKREKSSPISRHGPVMTGDGGENADAGHDKTQDQAADGTVHMLDSVQESLHKEPVTIRLNDCDFDWDSLDACFNTVAHPDVKREKSPHVFRLGSITSDDGDDAYYAYDAGAGHDKSQGQAEDFTVHVLDPVQEPQENGSERSQAAGRTRNLGAAAATLTKGPLPRLRSSKSSGVLAGLSYDTDNGSDGGDGDSDDSDAHSGGMGTGSGRTQKRPGYNTLKRIFESRGLSICVTRCDDTQRRLGRIYSDIVARFQVPPWELIPSSIRPGYFSYKLLFKLEQLARLPNLTIQEIQAEFLEQIRIAPPKLGNRAHIPEADCSKLHSGHVTAVLNRCLQRQEQQKQQSRLQAARRTNPGAASLTTANGSLRPRSVVDVPVAAPIAAARPSRRNPPPPNGRLPPADTIQVPTPPRNPSPSSPSSTLSEAATKALATLHTLLHDPIPPSLARSTIESTKLAHAATLARKKTLLGEATIRQKAYRDMHAELSTSYQGRRGDTSGQQLLDTMKQRVVVQDGVVVTLEAEVVRAEAEVRMAAVVEAAYAVFESGSYLET